MEIKKKGLIEVTESVSAVFDGYEVVANVTYTNGEVRRIADGSITKDDILVASFQRWGDGSKYIDYSTADEAEQDFIHTMLKEFFASVDVMFNTNTL